MRQRMKSWPAIAIALVALIFAMAGTATAARSLLTGKDIKDRSLTAVDVRKGALTSTEIKKGSIDLDRLSKNARRSLQGRTGAAGPAGAPGAPGPAGMAGYEVIERPEDRISHGTGWGSITLPCPSGKVAVNGGAKVHSHDVPGRTILYTESFPVPGGWRIDFTASANNPPHDPPVIIQPWIICVSAG